MPTAPARNVPAARLVNEPWLADENCSPQLRRYYTTCYRRGEKVNYTPKSAPQPNLANRWSY